MASLCCPEAHLERPRLSAGAELAVLGSRAGHRRGRAISREGPTVHESREAAGMRGPRHGGRERCRHGRRGQVAGSCLRSSVQRVQHAAMQQQTHASALAGSSARAAPAAAGGSSGGGRAGGT